MSATAITITMDSDSLNAIRNKFIALAKAGFNQPEYLARNVWPELFESMPALAIHEAKKYLVKFHEHVSM